MKFYSHSKENDQGEVFGSKELKAHILGVKEKALFHFSHNVHLGFSERELKEIIEVVTNLHDLGKYTSYFQNYLLKTEPIDHRLKQHARIGGFTGFNLLEKEEKKALLVFYLIFLHHSQLTNFSEVATKLDRGLNEVIIKQQENLVPSLKAIEEDIGIENLGEHIFYTEERKIRKGFRIWQKKEANIQDYFLINYLFSLLIEGDKLDASDTEPYSLKAINPLTVDKRFGKPEIQNNKLENLSNNELRNYCRAVVAAHIEDSDILDQYIFTLTAPTGIGKTMTALDFSLKLKHKIKEEVSIESRIIYALPFINIIEQALGEYQATLPSHTKILGHYQYADIFGEDKESGDGEVHNYNQKAMALDTWQADVVITSFVQFFETLIGNRNKLLKKFNHFANAIIILDEVQTLRLDQMPLIGATLFYLAKYLKARIILMTATRPKIFQLAEKEILNERNEVVNSKELLTTYEAVFSVFNRTAVYPLLDELTTEREERVQEFVSDIFSDKWRTEKSCLIVCNTVKLSIEVFHEVNDFLEENDFTNPVYYLSTNIIPAHRLIRIKAIKEDIQNGKSPILIATQVVEAGVDLDFDMGFRDIGPIDSIIQVAGRINRNNDLTRKHSPLYILDFDPKATRMVYGRLTYDQARKSLLEQSFFGENEYLKLVNKYFDDISDRSSFATSRAFFASMNGLNYHSDNKEEFPVSAFRIIEESNRYAAVFIEVDEVAVEARLNYFKKITGEISKEEFDKDWKLKFQQRIISVPKYLCDDLQPINEYEENILYLPKDELESTYFEDTGFNRNKKEREYIYVV